MTPEQIKHLEELVNKTGKRAPSFAMMINHALSIDNPLIVETGCARQENNFDGDGMSTIIFDKLVEYHGGDFYSVDINPDNVKFATSHCKNANVFCGDSVSFLYNQSKSWVANNRKIDLLYLDSYDFDLNNYHPSSLHHVVHDGCRLLSGGGGGGGGARPPGDVMEQERAHRQLMAAPQPAPLLPKVEWPVPKVEDTPSDSSYSSSEYERFLLCVAGDAT
jgi:hypothetical protein